MHKTLLIFLLSWAAIASAQNNDARIEQSIERANATIKGRFNELSTNKLPDFYKVWSEVSAQHAKTHYDKACDKIVQLIFDEYYRKEKTYVVLPTSIRVKVCNKKLGISPETREGFDYYEKYRELTKKPNTEYRCVPHLTTESKVLYGFTAAEELLDAFLDVETGTKLEKERVSEIEKNVSVHYNFASERWYAIDDTSIREIDFVSDGVLVNFSIDSYSHRTVFIPKGTRNFIPILAIEDD